ncbi:MAG: glycosyltransferase family 4 protein [Alphaproteobacteria bacterium]|nr:glycosyltransferase family 4 protein [Alphaproteobacteria bacterium]
MIVFDVSRLIARAAHVTPTGIDRVELAYARHWLSGTKPACFVRANRWGGLTVLPQAAIARYVEALGALWHDGASLRRRGRVRWAAFCVQFAGSLLGQALMRRVLRDAVKPVYLLVSHHHLEQHRLVARLKRRYGMSFVCLIHDLIPVEFPEYARPGQDEKHCRRVETAAALADAMIVPSAATEHALRAQLGSRNSALCILVAPFGVELPALAAAAAVRPDRPYFVCLGTIEPRKNHLLLLNLWRDFASRQGCRPPGLVLIGRRGWEIEGIVDMLDRCHALRGIVSESRRISDTQAVQALKNACALLLPSYAEGFGFPLLEALACGTPVLCSNIPALREIGGDIPEYFDPLDGAAWRAAILDYAQDPSPRREDQLRRMKGWEPPRWADHFAAVEPLLAELAAPATSAD